jgi:hypothetical protein
MSKKFEYVAGHAFLGILRTTVENLPFSRFPDIAVVTPRPIRPIRHSRVQFPSNAHSFATISQPIIAHQTYCDNTGTTFDLRLAKLSTKCCMEKAARGM